MEGLLAGLSASESPADGAAPRARTYVLFGTYRVCGHARIPRAIRLRSQRPGSNRALHYIPTLTCGCGSRVVELLYCEACGEIFLEDTGAIPGLIQTNGTLSPDHPDLEASPDMASLDRDYLRIRGVLARELAGRQPASHPVDARRCSASCGEPACFAPGRRQGRTRRAPGLPVSCPSRCTGPNSTAVCSASASVSGSLSTVRTNWARRHIGSPVRTQRTGFQKLAQVLSDALLRELRFRESSRANWLFSPTAGKTQRSSLPGCVLPTTGTPLRQALAAALANQGARLWHSSRRLTGQASRRTSKCSRSCVRSLSCREGHYRWPQTRDCAISHRHPPRGLTCQAATQQILRTPRVPSHFANSP